MNVEKQNQLVIRAQAGDSAAMDALFSEYYNNVYYFALKTVKDPDIACDITQETFMEIMQTIGNLKEPAAFMTWMKQITYHQCTRYFRTKKDVLLDDSTDEEGESILDNLVDESEGSIPAEILEKEEFRQTILGIINELSEEQRAAVLLYYFDELSVKQIAEIQNVSENTIKSRLNYARKAIKKSVEGYEQKTGIKLHSVAILPLLSFWLVKEVLPEAKAVQIHAAVMGSAGTAATAAATGAGAATTAAVAGTATTVGTTAAATAGTAAAATGGALAAKITAGIVAAALAVGGIGIATDVIPTPWTSPETTETAEQTETKPELSQATLGEGGASVRGYNNRWMSVFPESQEYQEVFGDYLSNRITYFLNKDGALVKREAPYAPVDFGSQADVQKVVMIGQYPGYVDSQGVYHIEGVALTDLEGTPAFLRIGPSSSGQDITAVISLTPEGKLYYNWYKADGDKELYDNLPIVVYSDPALENKLNTVSYYTEAMDATQSGSWSTRLIADGMVYRTDNLNLKLGQNNCVCSVESTDIPAEALLSTLENPALIYMVRDREDVICIDGVQFALPDGKSASQITQAAGAQEGVIFFEDGSVCQYTQSGITYNTKLTELNQAGAIRKAFAAYTSPCRVVFVMDDGLTYLVQVS